MNYLLNKTSGVALVAAMLTCVPTQAFSQTSGGIIDSRNENDEIIVTARKRAESIQDVPLAVSAFDEVEIKRRNIAELEDVARFTAGFAFEDFDGGNANPVIRGQSTLRATAREQTVATFLDGVYMPRSWLVDQGTSNMQRIEIVKGPQSARYGRNAFAGAINYITKKATGDTGVEGTLTVGTDERFDVGVGATFRINEVLAVRGSYDQTEFDGTWRNNHPNANAGVSPGTDGKVGGWDNQSWSANVLFTPTDALNIDLSYYGFDRSEEARATRWLNTRSGVGNCGTLQPTDGGGTGGSLFCGEYPVPFGEVTVDPRGFGRQSEGDILRAAVDFDINDDFIVSYLFGKVDADTITANTAESDTINCGTILGAFAGSPCNFQGSPLGDVDYTQHELRLTYANEGPIVVSVGGFLMDGTDNSFSVSANAPGLGTTPLAISDVPSPASQRFLNFVFRNETSETDVQSIFGELEFSLPNDQTRIGIEARYTSEEITTIDNRSGNQVGNETFNFFTPRFTVEHDINSDSLFYATVARGAKAGGFNSSAITPAFAVYDPEFNWTYEIGSKNTLLDNRLVLNAAAFLTKWKDQQISTLDPAGTPFTGALTSNLGNATVLGFEVEGSFDATDNLSFDGAFSYTDATYDDGTIDQLIARSGLGPFANPCDGIACNPNGDIGGNSLERSPDTQASLGVQWAAPINGTMDYYIRADGAYQSSFFADAINAAAAPSRTIFNASAGLNYNENIDFTLWARNLTDEKYVSNSLQIIQNFSNNILGTYFGERATFGVTVSARFP